MTATLTRARAQIARWRASTARFVRECLGVTPDAWQDDALEAFDAGQRTAMKACKGPGKTAVLAWCILKFMSCLGERGNHPKGAATSITEDNLKDNLWAELAKWRARSPFLTEALEWTQTRLFAKDHPETWFFSARTWPKTADRQRQADTLAGLHADYLLFVLDEAGGIPDAVMAAAEGGLATGRLTKLLMAGNPTHLEGPLYRACTSQAPLWRVIEISGDPDDPKRSPRVSAQWAREQIETYGRDNPWVLVNVFGRFPPASINALLGPDEVEAAMHRHVPEDAYAWAAKVLGVDVARFGDDRTILFPRQGLAAFQPVTLRRQRTTEIGARVAKAWADWDADACFLDDTGGWAHGTLDNLIEAHWTPIGVQFHAPALDPRYLNRRAEMYFALAEWVKAGGALPPSADLKRELTAITYTFRSGKLAIEDKDQIKARLGVSPDEADALALTFAEPVAPRRDALGGPGARDRQGPTAQTAFDPYTGEAIS